MANLSGSVSRGSLTRWLCSAGQSGPRSSPRRVASYFKASDALPPLACRPLDELVFNPGTARAVLSNSGYRLRPRGVSAPVIRGAVETGMAHRDEESTGGRVFLHCLGAASGVTNFTLTTGIAEEVGGDHFCEPFCFLLTV